MSKNACLSLCWPLQTGNLSRVYLTSHPRLQQKRIDRMSVQQIIILAQCLTPKHKIPAEMK